MCHRQAHHNIQRYKASDHMVVEELTCPALLKRWPARIIWKANLRTMGFRILIKQWAACSNSRALRRSESCTKNNIFRSEFFTTFSLDDSTCVLMIDTQAYTFKIVNLQTICLPTNCTNVCMYVEHMSKTIHFIGFRLGMCIFHAPKKCSVEFCANWTIGWTLIKKCINRQTALWSQWGAGLNRQPVDQVKNVFLYSLSSPADSNWWPVGQNCPCSNNIWPTRSFW